MDRIRMMSDGDVYHVTTRGVAQQTIFEDDDDRWLMVKLLSEAVDKLDVEIYAWCFMSNHIHLLLHGSLKDISAFMGNVLSRYAKRYNVRHARTGHLFQERFYSSPIDSDQYLLVAVRYIHFNPISSGANPISYQWSSYREYLGIGKTALCSTDFVLRVFGSVDVFRDFHATPNNDQSEYHDAFENSCITAQPTDDELIAIAKTLLGIDNISEVARANKSRRNSMIATLKTRMTVRQIARITGLGRNVVQRIK